MEKLFLTNKKILPEIKLWLNHELDHRIEPNSVSLIILAVNECIQNIYRYAYEKKNQKKILINYKKDPDNLYINVKDFGPNCSDKSFITKKHEPTEEGGMGIGIIMNIVTDYIIEDLNDGNLTKLTFSLGKLKKIDKQHNL
jgi:anti-sigma regulatory factor (Ser/Thr protein kinase)